MIRLIAYLLIVAAAAAGLAWVADRPGRVAIEWLGYDVRTSVFFAAIILILFFCLFALAVWLGILTLTAPKKLIRVVRRRQTLAGELALRRGIFAAGAGDRLAALKARAIAKRHIPDEPLTLLLEAQSAQLDEDPIASRQAFERMLERPEMAELGLRGLYIEAKKAGENEAAKQFAGKALTANPALAWSSAALFDIHCRESNWREALKTLRIASQNRHLGKAEAARRRALLLTQLAIELEDTQQTKALAYAIEAFDLSPSLVPAALVAGRILSAQGSTARAAKILTRAWKAVRHPEIALVLAHCRRGDSPRDRLARVKALIGGEPPSIEGAVALATAAIEAMEWGVARSALAPHVANTPPAQICRLMARIEMGENRDAGRAREWMAKAVRGAPDPAWVAPDGAISLEWQPISPISGALGAFEWKTPPSAQLESDEFIPEIAAMEASPEIEVSPVEAVKPEALPQEDGRVEPAPQRPVLSLESPAPDSPPAKAYPHEEGLHNGQRVMIEGKEGGTDEPPAKRLPRNKPTIFIPGPAPDDPGPRSEVEIEDDSTPLSRYRRPF